MADLASEQIILRMIQEAFPEHSIKSEERGHIPSASSAYQWLVDPLDGTENFTLGIPYFSSSITLCEHGLPLVAVVYNPVTNELFTAQKGQVARRNGEPLHVSAHNTLHGGRVFFIPDFTTKRQPESIWLRNLLYSHCRRVLDTWSSALDWCLVASGRVDLVVAVAGTPIPQSTSRVDPGNGCTRR